MVKAGTVIAHMMALEDMAVIVDNQVVSNTVWSNLVLDTVSTNTVLRILLSSNSCAARSF